MSEFTSPQVVVQRQLDACNAKNLDAWLATYSPQAQQFALGGLVLASGHAEIRERTSPRFQEPDLHAHLISRTVLGSIVIDHENVRRTFPEGPGQVEVVCIYVVERGLIQSATFSFAPPVLTPRGQ